MYVSPMQTAAALLSRTPHRAAPALPLLGGTMQLADARLHELCGPARWSLGAWIAGAVQRQREGMVLWVHASWQGEMPNPAGLVSWCAPERLLFVAVDKMEDMLWTMEEALRAGVVPLVVADAAELPSLTQVRRLHLAAEQGGARAARAPLGALLSPGPEGGAPGVETRWHLKGAHTAQRAAWELTRLRARTAPQARFRVERGESGLRVV
jgi:protein ImuA